MLRRTTTSRASLRAAAPLARHLSTTKKLSGAELDAAISEMNAEMSDLFGSTTAFDPRVAGLPTDLDEPARPPSRPPPARPAPPAFQDLDSAADELESFLAAHKVALEPAAPSQPPEPDRGARPEARAPSHEVERCAADAQVALCGKLAAFAAELARTTDVERSTKLAHGVSACASALAEVLTLQQLAGPTPRRTR